ncbi:hypothetical protein GCM10010286_29590 [Streptomyces toxytricini]|nr:hypothetical protein GCM10010286_29590 [Streptomyces toxytricini]
MRQPSRTGPLLRIPRPTAAEAPCDHPGMRLAADGATPIPRSVPGKHFTTDDGYAFELPSPLFPAVGDRIAFEGGGLVVVRAGGERLPAAGQWSTRCGPGSLRCRWGPPCRWGPHERPRRAP